MRLARPSLLTAIAILALSIAAIMHRWLLLAGVPASFRGEIVPEINYIWLIRQQIEAGHPFALWLPKFLGGEAVATHAAYPLYWMLALASWLLQASVEQVCIWADYLFFLGGAVGMLALVRRLTGQLAAGVVAGAIFSLIPAHLNAIEGFYLQCAWMLIPWAFWLIEKRCAQLSLSARDAAAPGLLLGVLLLLGIQMPMMMLPYILIYLLFREWQLWRSLPSPQLHFSATWWNLRGRFWLLSGLIGLGISLSFYLPTAVDLFNLGWSRYVSDELGVVVDLSFLWFMLHYRWSPEMTTLRWHHISWYLGDVAIGLALLGWLTHLRKSVNWLFLGFALFSFLLLVGESLGIIPNFVYRGVAVIPIFNGVLRRSFRFVLPFSLALAVLAGFGVATLLRWLQGRTLFRALFRSELRTAWTGLAVATLLSGAVLGDYWLHRGNFRMLPSYLEPERAALVDWLNQQPQADRYWIPFEYGLTADGYLRGYHVAAMHHLLNRPGIWDDSFVGHYASRRAAELLQACIVTHPLWADSLTPILSSMFDLANVRYLILNSDVEQQYKLLTSLTASDLPLVFSQGSLHVFENRDALPFVQFYAAAVHYTGTDLAAQFQDWLPLTQTRNLALLDNESEPTLSAESVFATDDTQAVAALAPAPVLQVSSTWQRPAPNHLQVAATLPQTTTLVVAEAWFPGWQVQVDGVRQPLLRANYAFMGVQLAAGSHTIDFIYRPPWYTWLGWAIASLTWAGALWLWVTKRLSEKSLLTTKNTKEHQGFTKKWLNYCCSLCCLCVLRDLCGYLFRRFLKLGKSNFMLMVRRLAPWGAFLALLAWGWRVYDLWNDLPAYGDALEVAWGIRWYYESLFVNHTSPFFDPLIFHPNGWYTATLAHTPLLFLLGSILMAAGATVALAYNLLALGSLVLAFAGAKRFLQLYTSEFAAVVAALIFTFLDARWTRVGGHFNMLFATSLFPWFLTELVQLDRTPLSRSEIVRRLALAALLWAAMVHFSLYSLFLVLPAFLIWGRRFFSWRNFVWMLAIVAGMLLLAAPLLWLYRSGTQSDVTIVPGVAHVATWGASLDTLFLPSFTHPLAALRAINHWFFSGVDDESTIMNLAPLTWGLALWGLWRVGIQKKSAARLSAANIRPMGLLWFGFASLLLALGVMLRWNGVLLESPRWAALNAAIWQIGRTFKPWLFDQAQPPLDIQNGIPLPGYFLLALIPYWESARVVARHVLFGTLGLLGFAAIGMDRCSPRWQPLLAAIWLITMLPAPTGNVLLPNQPHPAHAFASLQQSLQAGEGIVDLTANPAKMLDGAIVYATALHHLPTVSGVGSFAPLALHNLQKWLASDRTVLSKAATAYMLGKYGVRYVLLHIQQPSESWAWQQIRANPGLRARDCFDPPTTESPWNYPVCVAEVLANPSPNFNLWVEEGWSGAEEWGRWAESKQVIAQWVARKAQAQQLQITAFPNCVPDQQQRIVIRIAEQTLVEHRWQQCEEWQATIPIPAEWVQVGWNQLDIDFDFALPPAAAPGDPRRLAVGFGELKIE